MMLQIQNPVVTILTPTYNKSKTIRRTFESLLRQTNFNFEWLIINDGSTDDSLDLIKTFETDRFLIRYIDKVNEGLNRTWNLGVREASCELIMRVDPDDYLTEDAIEQVLKYKECLDNDSTLCSVVFLTKYSDGKLVGTHPFSDIQKTNFIDYRIKYKAKGDRMEIMKRDVLLKYPMPEIEGEKFCMESVMQQNIALHFDALYIPCAIYVREYNEDSITSNITKIMRNNPKGAILVYSQYVRILLNKRKIGIDVNYELLTNGINFYRFGFCSYREILKKSRELPTFLSIICLFPAILFYLIDGIKPDFVSKLIKLIRK